MFIQNFQKIINTYVERVLPFLSYAGNFIEIKSNGDKILLTYNDYGSVWQHQIWMNENELFIEDPNTKESIFDYYEEMDLTNEEVQYIRFGKK